MNRAWLVPLFAMMLLATAAFVVAVPDEGDGAVSAEYDGMTYSIDTRTTATLIGGKNVANVNIPSTIYHDGHGYRVTAIGEDAFLSYSRVTTLTIPGSVETIGDYAFYGCAGLQTLTIPEGVKSIGSYAFFHCTGLMTVSLPDTLTTIGYRSFEGCSSLYFVYIPDSVKTIGTWAFDECTSLTTVYVPAGAALGSGVFGAQTFYNTDGRTEIYSTSSTFPGHTYAGATVDRMVMQPAHRIVFDIDGATGDAPETLELNEGQKLTFPGCDAKKDGCYFGGWSAVVAIFQPGDTVAVGRSDMTFQAHWVAIDAKSCGDGVYWYMIGTDLFIYADGSGSGVMDDFVEYDPDGSYDLEYPPWGTDITSVSFDGDIQNIGIGAFAGCYDLNAIEIPEPVRSIGDYAFAQCGCLQTIGIPATVNFIGGYTFVYCEVLDTIHVDPANQYYTSVDGVLFSKDMATLVCVPGGYAGVYTVPESVVIIGEAAFFGCCFLDQVYFEGDNLRQIMSLAFCGCDCLNYVDLPFGLDDIMYGAFSGCDKMTNPQLPDTLRFIGAYAFDGCSGIHNIRIPASVEIIGNGAFGRCNNLQTLEFAEGSALMYIDAYAFESCTSLFYVDLPDGIIGIGDHAFDYCRSLEFVGLPDSLKSIEYRAFFDCESLLSMEFPESLEYIGPDAFYFCPYLTSLTFKGGDARTGTDSFMGFGLNEFTVPAGSYYLCGEQWSTLVLFTPEMRQAILGGSPSGYVEIPDYIRLVGDTWEEAVEGERGALPVMAIAPGAFEGCDDMENVYIPDTVQYIGIDAFSCCSSLRQVELPDSLQYLMDGAFYRCRSLEKVEFNDQLLYIGSDCFNGCGMLLNAEIPALVEDIAPGAFRNCGSLATVTIEGERVYTYNGSFDGEGLNSTCLHRGTYYKADGAWYDEAVLDYQMRNDVFGSTKGYITIPAFVRNDSGRWRAADPGDVRGIPVVAIGDEAFYNCFDMTAVEFPDSVVRISYEAFTACDSLRAVYLSDSIREIGFGAFAHCTSLRSMYLPPSLEHLGDNVFEGCAKLERITMPNSVTFAGSYLFYDCESLRSVDLSESLTEINAGTFNCCVSLESVYIPDSVSRIGWAAFEGCEALKTVSIGGPVTTIPEKAFNGCSSLVDVELPGDLRIIESSAFRECTSLKFIRLPERMETVGDMAFYKCPLERVYVAYNISEIGKSAFYPAVFYDYDGITKLRDYQIPGYFYTGSNGQLVRTDCNHSWYNREVLSEPTCQHSGTERYTCSICGEKEYLIVFDWSHDIITDRQNYVAPTCTEDGSIDFVETCAECGEVFSKRTESIPATGHVFDDNGVCMVCGYSGSVPGDLNGDGNVDSDDAIYLLYSTFFPNQYPVSQAIDYNHDGMVDSDDAIYLLYHTFFPNQYPI